MKKGILLILTSILFIACSSSKSAEKNLYSGNYDQAINTSIKKLRANKNKKNSPNYITTLKEAFQKAEARDLNRVSYLEEENNPANYESIYKLYRTLDSRQEAIKPILPLYINGNEIPFRFKNYNSQIIKAKEDLSSYLYQNANALLNSNSKTDFRRAYDEFNYIEQINPNYRNVNQLKSVAHKKGIDYVIIEMINNTRQVIPQRLENELLNFDTYGLNSFWTVYHNSPNPSTQYSFAINVILQNIIVSPEQIKERQITNEKQIKDGWKYATHKNGSFVKDSLGNRIKIDNFKTIRCNYFETRQFKASRVSGNVELVNLENRQLIKTFPLQSEFIFEHFYSTARGDRRALDENLLIYLDNRRIPFPSDEQMIYDNGEDLKLQLKNIITGNNF